MFRWFGSRRHQKGIISDSHIWRCRAAAVMLVTNDLPFESRCCKKWCGRPELHRHGAPELDRLAPVVSKTTVSTNSTTPAHKWLAPFRIPLVGGDPAPLRPIGGRVLHLRRFHTGLLGWC